MRVAIVMEGGLVQEVITDIPKCAYAVLDRDSEGVEPEWLRRDPADRHACTIETGEAEAEPDYVAAVFGAAGATAVPTDTEPEPLALLADIVAAHDNWRDCSDTRESLNVWSESVNKARRAVRHLTSS